jgi:alginate O-acetyltransferase complex protein AlgI
VRSGTVEARRILIVGILGNLAVLCYYKYADFLLSIIENRKAIPPHVPLALSFTTFVQIAFLVHVHHRKLAPDFRRYALFVAFFPHLIAGPVVRWSSLGRQLDEVERFRINWANIALGLTIFTLGLAKKVLIADRLSPHVGALFDAAARGEPIMAAAAWGGCFAFVAQIYFDFSGYSDMAIGLGLLFNLHLPVNFAAPLRATSMLDLWRRWHVTVSRLARDLIYVPLSRGDQGSFRRSFNLGLTMMVLGIWHGAGWTFVAWGAYNVVLILINQSWQSMRGLRRPSRFGRLVGWFLTFTAFCASSAFFRAADIETSWHLITAMTGFGGAPIPDVLTIKWDQWGIRRGYISEEFVRAWFGNAWTLVGTLWTALALVIALLMPDTLEIVNYRYGDAQSEWRRRIGDWVWSPTWITLAATSALLVAGLMQLGQVSEFLYFQF